MMFRPNPSSGVPIYLQLMEQVKHGIETGALRPGEQLPGIRPLAEELVINPNTVAKAYRELEHEGIIELRHGAGAFVSATARAKKLTDKLRAGQAIVAAAMEKLRARGVTDEEIRRLVEAELAGVAEPGSRREWPGGDRNGRAWVKRTRRGGPASVLRFFRGGRGAWSGGMSTSSSCHWTGRSRRSRAACAPNSPCCWRCAAARNS